MNEKEIKIDQQARLLTVRQTARYMRVSEKFIYHGRLAIDPVRLGKAIRYDIRDLDRLIETSKR